MRKRSNFILNTKINLQRFKLNEDIIFLFGLCYVVSDARTNRTVWGPIRILIPTLYTHTLAVIRSMPMEEQCALISARNLANWSAWASCHRIFIAASLITLPEPPSRRLGPYFLTFWRNS